MSIIIIPPSSIFYPASAGAHFDGSTAYVSKSSVITGSDSARGIISAWVRQTTSPVETKQLIFGWDTSSLGFIQIGLSSIGKAHIIISKTNTGTDRLHLQSTSTYTSTTRFIHILSSWDTAFAAGARLSSLYVNDTNQKNVLQDTGSSFVFPYSTAANWRIGAGDPTYAGAVFFPGDVSNVYFYPGQYLDFSIDANRRKFISPSARPINLGSDASLPVGSAPALFMKGIGTGFNVNSGSGGNFTTTGTLTTPTTTPST